MRSMMASLSPVCRRADVSSAPPEACAAAAGLYFGARSTVILDVPAARRASIKESLRPNGRSLHRAWYAISPTDGSLAAGASVVNGAFARG